MRRLGDRFSRVLTPEGAEKLGKCDVTGVGLNLIVSDMGQRLAPLPPSSPSLPQATAAHAASAPSPSGRPPARASPPQVR